MVLEKKVIYSFFLLYGDENALLDSCKAGVENVDCAGFLSVQYISSLVEPREGFSFFGFVPLSLSFIYIPSVI